MATKILGVVGSLRAKSHTRKLIKLTLDLAGKHGAEVRLLDLSETRLPMYDPDNQAEAEAQTRARELVTWADAYLLGSPDYHGSVSGPLINFLDYFWTEFTGKLFGYIVASHEKGLTVQDQMRTAVRQCYGWSLPYGIGFNGDADFEKDGTIKTPALAERAEMLARDLAVYGGLLRSQFVSDLAKTPRDPGFARNFKD